MSTYIAGSRESPDGRYVAFVHVRGAGGRSYIDLTRKTVFISIETIGTERPTIVTNYQNGVVASLRVVAVNGKPGKPLLERKYHIKGSDVCWNAIWGKDDDVTVSLFDYGVGVSSYDAEKNGAPKREIRTLRYELDSRSGAFLEEVTH